MPTRSLIRRSGWLSFTQPVSPNVVAYHGDDSHGMLRVETTCAVCDAHLDTCFRMGRSVEAALLHQRTRTRQGEVIWDSQSYLRRPPGVRLLCSGLILGS